MKNTHAIQPSINDPQHSLPNLQHSPPAAKTLQLGDDLQTLEEASLELAEDEPE